MSNSLNPIQEENISYAQALSMALCDAMEENPRLFVMGEGVDDPKGIFGTTLDAYKKFGAKRVWDTPLSESAMTGVGIGAAIEGYPCLMVHQRNEFLLLAMDQVVNHAAKWRYMFGEEFSVPITIRSLIGRGWGQAAQHSQSLHALFAHIPGLKVVLPSTPRMAKGLLYSALLDPNPVLIFEHRWLYSKKEYVPVAPYKESLDKCKVMTKGKDITCVAVSYQVYEALEAQKILQSENIEMEVIDLACLCIDKVTILESLRKTGRLLLTDIGHKSFGVLAEVAAMVSEEALPHLKAPIMRVALPDVPTPCSSALEEAYYPQTKTLVDAARKLVKGKNRSASVPQSQEQVVEFLGPF